MTILIGRCDTFMPAEQQGRPRAQFDDVAVTGGGRFLLFLRPGVVAEVIAGTFMT